MADRQVRPRTHLGLDRAGLYNQFAERGFQEGCEVGVYLGANAIKMFETMPGLHLLCVDPYRHYGRYMAGIAWARQRKAHGTRRQALRNLAGYDVSWMMIQSHIAARQVRDESLDFVYIDASHSFDNVMQDILSWTPKLRYGGVLSGHDYGVPAVFSAVNTYSLQRGWQVYITDRKLERYRNMRSWMMEKKSDR